MSQLTFDVGAMCDSRPEPDASLEQFLMESEYVAHQATYLTRLLPGSLVILGDDDHVSIPVALQDEGREICVIDVDQRVLASLERWINILGIRNVRLVCKDLRDADELDGKFDAFYGNPPWSSKNFGHGIRYWLSRALDFCAPSCSGAIAMPANDIPWINFNWVDLEMYSARNGLRWMTIDEVRCRYESTNHPGLYSQNVIMRRVSDSLRMRERRREGDGIYR